MKKILLFTLLFTAFTGYSQKTAIPDVEFEQELIDLDYDDVIDGEVLTANINTVTELQLSFSFIEDYTGIEDFIALETLDVSFSSLTSIDLSNNTNLIDIDISNNDLTSINLKNGNNTNIIYLDASGNGVWNDDGDLETPIACITVDDPDYSETNWRDSTIFYFENETSFSTDCSATASTKDLKEISFQISPNPTSKILNIESTSTIDNIILFDITGKEVFSSTKSEMNISKLSSGIYIVKLISGNKQAIKKIIKR